MLAVVYDGTNEVAVREVEDAVVEEPTDVVVRVTASAICGTDLHMYDGRTGAEPGLVLGHEPLGGRAPGSAGSPPSFRVHRPYRGARAAPTRPGTGPTQVVDDLARLVNPTGHLGIAGVYAEKDLSPAVGGDATGALTVPWATLFGKGVTVGFGRTHDRRYTTRLRDLVVSGRARPGRIVTHHGTLADARSCSGISTAARAAWSRPS